MAKQILITTDKLGRSDEDLGRILMRSFLVSLARAEHMPAAVLLVNEGVKLACESSTALGELKIIAEAGVVVRACHTCLKHFDLLDKLVVGEAGDMPGLVAAVTGPDELVTIG